MLHPAKRGYIGFGGECCTAIPVGKYELIEMDVRLTDFLDSSLLVSQKSDVVEGTYDIIYIQF